MRPKIEKTEFQFFRGISSIFATFFIFRFVNTTHNLINMSANDQTPHKCVFFVTKNMKNIVNYRRDQRNELAHQNQTHLVNEIFETSAVIYWHHNARTI